MSNLLQDTVLPALRRIDVPVLSDPARPECAFVPVAIDDEHGVRTLVHIVTNDRGGDLQLWTGLLSVPQARRLQVLEQCNRLNAERRWIKCVLNGEAVVIEADVELAFSRDPRAEFTMHFANFTDALLVFWPDFLRAASLRQRRSRLQRDVEGVLRQIGD